MDLESEDYRRAQNADGIGLCLLDTRQEFVLFLPLRRETAFSGGRCGGKEWFCLFLSTPPASFCKNEGNVSLHMTKNISFHPRLKKVENI